MERQNNKRQKDTQKGTEQKKTRRLKQREIDRNIKKKPMVGKIYQKERETDRKINSHIHR
jgi:hypothetical protein